MSKVEYEVLERREIPFGKDKFIEVARTKAISEKGTNVFISVTKGNYSPDGQRIYKGSTSLPLEKNILEQVCLSIKELSDI